MRLLRESLLLLFPLIPVVSEWLLSFFVRKNQAMVVTVFLIFSVLMACPRPCSSFFQTWPFALLLICPTSANEGDWRNASTK